MIDSDANLTWLPRLRVESESLLVIEFEPRIDERINAQAVAFAEAVRTAALQGVLDVVPTFRTVAVHLDPVRTDWAGVTSWIDAHLLAAPPTEVSAGDEVEIPVRYGGDDGPDLDEVARRCQLAPDEVVRLHTDVVHRVFMMGFVPGFAYLGILPVALRLPRRERPRLRVAAGSVAIADQLSGIYPSETPGGWHLIGRTDVRLFDAAREAPSLLNVGMRVRFRAVQAGTP